MSYLIALALVVTAVVLLFGWVGLMVWVGVNAALVGLWVITLSIFDVMHRVVR